MNRLTDAFQLAATLHAAQVRKGTTIPYLAHLMAVAALVLEAGGDEDLAIAALLHDAVEDAPDAAAAAAVRTDVERRFGPRVLRIVDACTDGDPAEKRTLGWRARKQRYLAHLERTDADARLVSQADKLHNARAILRDYRAAGEALWTRFNGGRDGTLWYYRALVQAYRRAGGGPLVEDLERTVDELEALAEMR